MHHDIGGFAAEVSRNNGHAVVAVRGEIDMATAGQLWTALEAAMDACSKVEVDLRETTFIDSSGLAVLVKAHHRSGRAPDAIVVREPSAAIRKILALAGMDKLFDLRDGNGAG